MPLRDHFRPPLDDIAPWEAFHNQWPAMIVQGLARTLPRRFVAYPRARYGSSLEIDVGTVEKEDSVVPKMGIGNGNGGVATAIWAPPRPALTIATDPPTQDEFEIRIHDIKRGRRLVAAVEIVSPANKDRSETRRAFVAKCAALLQDLVSVTVIDLVTVRGFNLYRELLEYMGYADTSTGVAEAALYGVACRHTRPNDKWRFETWPHTLLLGQPLPTFPLWLADNFSVPLELEPTYEETCKLFQLA